MVLHAKFAPFQQVNPAEIELAARAFHVIAAFVLEDAGVAVWAPLRQFHDQLQRLSVALADIGALGAHGTCPVVRGSLARATKRFLAAVAVEIRNFDLNWKRTLPAFRAPDDLVVVRVVESAKPAVFLIELSAQQPHHLRIASGRAAHGASK